MKHKHAEYIRAWADGAQIQVKAPFSKKWEDSECPRFYESYEYRIKPETKHDVILEMHMTRFSSTMIYVDPNLRLTFDGETGELKKAEVL